MVPNKRSRVAGNHFPLKFSLDASAGFVAAQEEHTMTTAITTRDFNGTPFVFREDGWFNMTKAAKHFGKDLQSFIRMDDTCEYIDALKANPVSGTEYLTAARGRNGGTWAHPKLAVFFARWLDVRFAVWCKARPGGLTTP